MRPLLLLAAYAASVSSRPTVNPNPSLQKRQFLRGSKTFLDIASQAEQMAIKAAQGATSNSSSGLVSLNAIRSRKDTTPSTRNPSGINSINNNNPDPPIPVFPQVSPEDAPYSLDEETLRGAIFIPDAFASMPGNGEGIGVSTKQPVLLVPGTAVMAGDTYQNNLIPLLTTSDFADPLWLNIPNASLSDAQLNAEFVAYAINYVFALTSRKSTLVAWSQGNLNAQWALKYWPSTRGAVTDHVALSADFKGTTLAALPCGGLLNLVGCTPAVKQQDFKSKFVKTLRSGGGDSAFVPTTSIFSATDEIVQPQSGDGASGFMGDERGVGVTNVEVQKECPGTPAGAIITHEGMLYNPLAFALLEDAIRNEGPGRTERIDKGVCREEGAAELGATEIVQTEAILVDAAVNLLGFKEKVFREPGIKAYA